MNKETFGRLFNKDAAECMCSVSFYIDMVLPLPWLLARSLGYHKTVVSLSHYHTSYRNSQM